MPCISGSQTNQWEKCRGVSHAPSMAANTPKKWDFTEKRKYARRHHSSFAHIRAYAIRPHSWRRKTFTNRCHPSPHPQRINGKNAGAYRIRPTHGRTRQKMGTFTEKRKYARNHHSLFAHIRVYAIHPHNWRQKLSQTYASHHRIPNKQIVNM